MYFRQVLSVLECFQWVSPYCKPVFTLIKAFLDCRQWYVYSLQTNRWYNQMKRRIHKLWHSSSHGQSRGLQLSQISSESSSVPYATSLPLALQQVRQEQWQQKAETPEWGTDCPTGSDRKTRQRCHICHPPVCPHHYCLACTDCM